MLLQTVLDKYNHTNMECLSVVITLLRNYKENTINIGNQVVFVFECVPTRLRESLEDMDNPQVPV